MSNSTTNNDAAREAGQQQWNVYRYAWDKWELFERCETKAHAEARARTLRAEAIAGREAARSFYVGNPGQVVNGTTLAA